MITYIIRDHFYGVILFARNINGLKTIISTWKTLLNRIDKVIGSLYTPELSIGNVSRKKKLIKFIISDRMCYYACRE